jgi:hypothetical protein
VYFLHYYVLFPLYSRYTVLVLTKPSRLHPTRRRCFDNHDGGMVKRSATCTKEIKHTRIVETWSLGLKSLGSSVEGSYIDGDEFHYGLVQCWLAREWWRYELVCTVIQHGWYERTGQHINQLSLVPFPTHISVLMSRKLGRA